MGILRKSSKNNKEKLVKEFAFKILSLQKALEVFSVSDENKEKLLNFENAIKSQPLKDEFRRIRIYRNKLTHDIKLSDYSANQLEYEISSIDKYIKWLKDNYKALYKSVK